MGNETKQKYFKIRIKMTKKYVKNCSSFLVIKETKIKITLIFHLTTVIMTKIKNKDNKCLWILERGILIHC